MKNSPESSRRGFIKKLATSTAAVAVGTNVLAASAAENNTAHFQIHKRQFSAINDNINIALIGAGGMGTQDTLTALKVPGVKLVAVCDPVSYTHLRAHETDSYLVCRLLLE